VTVSSEEKQIDFYNVNWEVKKPLLFINMLNDFKERLIDDKIDILFNKRLMNVTS
jgi:hypothetical protein